MQPDNQEQSEHKQSECMIEQGEVDSLFRGGSEVENQIVSEDMAMEVDKRIEEVRVANETTTFKTP